MYCRTGQAPKQWQTSVMIPIHKKGDNRKCTNYRDISLISVPDKVYAKCLEKKCHEIVEPKLTDAQCVIKNTSYQKITLSWVIKNTRQISYCYSIVVDLSHFAG